MVWLGLLVALAAVSVALAAVSMAGNVVDVEELDKLDDDTCQN